MKKLVLIAAIIFSSVLLALAQDNVILYIVDRPNDLGLCLGHNQTVYVYSQEGCTNFQWYLNGQSVGNPNPLVINPTNGGYAVTYDGCGLYYNFGVGWHSTPVPTAFVHDVWKRLDGSVEIEAVGADSTGWQYGYSYQWSTGATTRTIEVSQTGIYTCEISNVCGSVVRTFIVKDNVELYRATVDLETNLNKVTWQTTEAQAEYINQVKVYRDGFFVGIAPYENGYFLDAIGSDNAARNYQIVGVTPEGEDCPIASYQKGTIHTTYYLDVNDNLNMTWNIPYVEQGAQGSLTYFQVCKYDPVTEQLTVVDQVNSLITDYTCGVNQFAGGYPVIAAVFSNSKDREFEDMSFSNMYTDIAIQPQEITITLTPGWNWISYPYAVSMGIDEALGDFMPVEGDIIKSRLVSSSYTNGRWRGGVNHFTPGWGYMYYSSRNEPATLVFDLSSSRR